jgi:hypothetical protein
VAGGSHVQNGLVLLIVDGGNPMPTDIYIYISPTIMKDMKDMKDIERWSNCENSSLYSIAVSWSSGALHRRQRKPRVQARLDIGGKGMQCAEISHVGRQSLAAFPTLQAANICCILNIPKL